MIDRLGLEEGEMIESGMVTRAIENAQKRVEENNFGIRKRLLEYDDVMNKQRTYIYARRHHALIGERVGIDLENMLWDVVENLVNTYDQPTDYDDLSMELMKIFTIEMPFDEATFASLSNEDRITRIHEAITEARERRSEQIAAVAMPVIKDWVENRGAQGKIAVPITDGKRIFNIVCDINEAYRTECKSIVKEWHKTILLVTIDELWKEHLRELDQLRQSVQNASYEQKDPLVIYKVESFHLFEGMLNRLNEKTMSALMRGQIFVQPPRQQAPADGTVAGGAQDNKTSQPEVKQAMPERQTDYTRYRTSRAENPGEDNRRAASAPQGHQAPPQPTVVGPKVGRNDPCPCGSGKKYKNCHGKGL